MARYLARISAATLLVVATGCRDGGSADAPAAAPAGRSATLEDEDCAPPEDPAEPPDDVMSPTRVLRRMTVALRGSFPTAEEYDALLATSDRGKDRWLEAKASELLADPAFYDRMVQVAQDWIQLPPYPNASGAPDYRLLQMRSLKPCEEGTTHAGAYQLVGNGGNESPCDGFDQALVDEAGNPLPARLEEVEPWWAPGTTVQVVGRAAVLERFLDTDDGRIDCGRRMEASTVAGRYLDCGCGPHLLYCNGTPRWHEFKVGSEHGQRRLLWEEPARLFAHLVWHDRPLTDLVLGNYSVGPRKVQAAYVRHGRRTGATQLDDFDGWWRTSTWSAPTDPHHSATDPNAWSEFELETRHPYLLSDRDVRFDPSTDPPEALAGLPSAGMLTTLGVLTSWTRERVRGARLLEILACESFAPPPADQHFNEYINDPGAQGPCQHCHSRIDPASIHFKRFARHGNRFLMLGVGEWHFPDKWFRNEYPYHGDPWERMNRLWLPGTRMTPVSPEVVDENPEAIWVDFLPPDQTLLGQQSDGTVGPLGFGKMIVRSGAFDRCVVRRLHEAIVGRDVDPVREAGYLGALVDELVAGDRKARPFIETLVTGEAFRRGL
jgi:hypothetical protein